MPGDFCKVTLKDLIKAVEGFKEDRKELWEMVRIQCAHSVAPHHDRKKGALKYSDIVLPIDPPKKHKVGKRIALDKAGIKEAYLSSGFVLSEEKLEKIVNENKN